MRKLILGLSLILMALAFQLTMVTPGNAQAIVVMNPWLGPGTPWYFWNNAWYYNGVLYGFYGPNFGWRPFGAVTEVVVEQPTYYYNNPQWARWNHSHPEHLQQFHHQFHGGIKDPHYRPNLMPGQRANPNQGQHGPNHMGQSQMHAGQQAQMHVGQQAQMHGGQQPHMQQSQNTCRTQPHTQQPRSAPKAAATKSKK